MKLKDKVAIVTGSGRGIGRAVAINIAKEGGKLVLVSRTESELLDTKKSIIDAGGKALIHSSDVCNENNIKNIVKLTLKEFGKIDILVNAAGALLLKNTVDMTADDWDFILNVNLRAVFLFSREVLISMIRQNYGKIINFSSELGKKGMAARTAYSAAKHGVVGLTEAMASEVKKNNININAICPGGVDSAMVRNNFPPGDYSKLIQPVEIAKVVIFLASDDSAAIKGKLIEVCGGQDLIGYEDDEEFVWKVSRNNLPGNH